MFVAALGLYAASAGMTLLRGSLAPHYVYLAYSLLRGHVDLVTLPPTTYDLLAYQGKWFVAGSPLPAILLMPFVSLWGLGVSDIVSGVVAAADVEMGYQVFNLGRSQPVLMRDLVTVLEGLIGKPARWRNAPLPPTDLPVTFADTTKANRMLGYSPRISIQEGLSQFWNWYKANISNSPPG